MAVQTIATLKANMPIGTAGGTSVQDIHDIVDTFDSRMSAIENENGSSGNNIDIVRTRIRTGAPLAMLAGWANPPDISNPPVIRVSVLPTDNLQTKINSAPEGTMFILQPGVYRAQVTPKKGQSFIGMGRHGAVKFNGSIVQSGAITQDGSIYVIAGVPVPQWQVNYGGEETYWGSFREDLFIDDVLYQRVATDGELGPGKWRQDGTTARLTDNPTGKVVELGQKDLAIGGGINDIYLENIVFEKYANPAIYGVVAPAKGGGGPWMASGWTMKNCTVRWCHGAGVNCGNNMKIIDCIFTMNGQIGITSDATQSGDGIGARNVLVYNCEVSYNNYATFARGWGAGGIKFLHTTNVTIYGCDIHHNNGTAVWFDWENIGVNITNNHIYENVGLGIQLECCLGGRVVGNLLRRNVNINDTSAYWGSEIFLQDSSNFDIIGNTLNVSFGDGINIAFFNRTSTLFGRFLAIRNRVVGNRTVLLYNIADSNADPRTDSFIAGINTSETGPDADLFKTTTSNEWDYNSYVMPDDPTAMGYWLFYGVFYGKNTLAGRPHDQNSTYLFVPGSGSNSALLQAYESLSVEDAHLEIDPQYLKY